MARLLPLLFLVLGAGGLATLAITRPTPEPLEAREKVWVVDVMPASPRSLQPTLTLFARVDSPRAASLTAALDADVEQVLAREGMTASVGEVLVRLDDRDARLRLAQREADVAELRAELANEAHRHENNRRSLAHEERLLALAGRDVERAQRLAKKDLGSAARLDESLQAEARQALTVDNRRMAISEHTTREAMLQARLARARALVGMARLELDRTVIKAPFDGRIFRVSVAPGDRVRPGALLAGIFDADTLELRAQVPTRYVAALRQALRQGNVVTARATLAGETVTARLNRLGSQVERGRGGTDALFSVVGPANLGLELGRILELRVSLPAEEDVVAIPAEALYGTDRIYLLDDSRMLGVQVERLGEHRDNQGHRRLLVRSTELREGRSVIITQLPNAVDGLRVRPAR